MKTVDSATLASCCSVSYGHPAARWLLGDSFHPGGLRLTSHVAQLLALRAGSTVLDAGCGRGASAVHLAKTLGCRVTGISLEREGIEAARQKARQEGVEGLVEFIEGDVLSTPLREGRFDAVLTECVLSILPDKPGALRRFAGALSPGGRLAMTDVTVSGELPPELQGVLAIAGCVGDARSLDGYAGLVEDAGLVVETRQDLKETAAGFLKEIKGKLLIAEIGAKLGKLPIGPELVLRAKELLAGAQGLVQDGTLGYGLLIARKPG